MNQIDNNQATDFSPIEEAAQMTLAGEQSAATTATATEPGGKAGRTAIILSPKTAALMNAFHAMGEVYNHMLESGMDEDDEWLAHLNKKRDHILQLFIDGVVASIYDPSCVTTL